MATGVIFDLVPGSGNPELAVTRGTASTGPAPTTSTSNTARAGENQSKL